MSARPLTQAIARGRQSHHIPIGLQIAAKLLDGYDAHWSYVREHLAAADTHALAILADPIPMLEHEGAAGALDALARAFGAEPPAKKIVDALRDAQVSDPESWVTAATIPWSNAGLYLGLCLGWRLAGALSGKEGR